MVDTKEDQEEIVFITTEQFQEFLDKYTNNMQSLNRVLSSYEDEINSLKSLVHDLSYKVKAFQQMTTPAAPIEE